jgi:hypothetical protein
MVVVAEDLLCAMMMTVPLVMPFVRGILFGMHLVNSKRLRQYVIRNIPALRVTPW